MNHHTFCLPASAIEWHAILHLADALGLGYRGRIACTFDDCNRIWVTYSGEKSDIPNITAFHNDAGAGPQVPVPAFIVGMYRLAENRKASPPPEPQAGSIRYAWDETRGMWKEAPTSDQIAGLEKRIKELETNDALFRRDLNGVWVAWTTGIGWEPLNPDDYLQRVAFLDYRFEKHLDFTSNSIITPLADLERQVRNLETALDRHMINTRDGMRRIQKSIDATMRYERHAGETTSADPLKGTTAAGAGDQVTNDPLEHYFMEDCCCIMIDASKSPKNIPFEVALAYLKAGRKVRRYGWERKYLLMNRKNGTGYQYVAMATPDVNGEGLSSAWQPLATELAENDWEAIPEP